jgi:hypothetical protein
VTTQKSNVGTVTGMHLTGSDLYWSVVGGIVRKAVL